MGKIYLGKEILLSSTRFLRNRWEATETHSWWTQSPEHGLPWGTHLGPQPRGTHMPSVQLSPSDQPRCWGPFTNPGWKQWEFDSSSAFGSPSWACHSLWSLSCWATCRSASIQRTRRQNGENGVRLMGFNINSTPSLKRWKNRARRVKGIMNWELMEGDLIDFNNGKSHFVTFIWVEQ